MNQIKTTTGGAAGLARRINSLSRDRRDALSGIVAMMNGQGLTPQERAAVGRFLESLAGGGEAGARKAMGAALADMTEIRRRVEKDERRYNDESFRAGDEHFNAAFERYRDALESAGVTLGPELAASVDRTLEGAALLARVAFGTGPDKAFDPSTAFEIGAAWLRVCQESGRGAFLLAAVAVALEGLPTATAPKPFTPCTVNQ
jgi:hypothetical protein